MNFSIPKKYFRISLLLSAALSLIIHFSLIANFCFEQHRGSHDFSFGFITFELITTFIIAIILFYINYFYYKPFDLNSKLTYKKVISSIILTAVISVFIISVLSFVGNPFMDEGHLRRHNEILFSRNLFGAAVILVCIFIIRLIFQKQAIELEVERLRTKSIQSQFEALKNQLSPHFLFNSLTALKSLIEEAPETANTYINHLSQVLRHSLQSHKKELVTLKEELELTQSYVFLLKIRYGTNLSVETKINNKYQSFEIPPLTVQNLVENAVKHNEISKEHPLQITIQTSDNGYLEVINVIQEKLTPEEGTGIGLTNLIKLYKLLGKEDVQIFQNNKEFRVEVPLIKPTIYEDTDN